MKIDSYQDMLDVVREVGFLPLFAGDVDGFSVEDMVEPGIWWTGDWETDPWEWRIRAARENDIIYGKFFNKKAGFISKEWLPVFANYRRDGYDFDSRWDDGKASYRQKKLMDFFMGDENEDNEIFSSELKKAAGFGKDGEKNFEGTLTDLEMETYLICYDFRQRLNKKGEKYGWDIAVLSTPEKKFGYDVVTSGYDEDPKDSLKRITDRVYEYFPDASEKDILKLVAFSDDRPKGGREKLPFPQNLLKDIDKDIDSWEWTDDQISGLYVAIGQLLPKEQKTLWMKYHDGMTNDQIGLEMNRAAGTISTYRRKAFQWLHSPIIAAWYRDGYQKNVRTCAWSLHWDFTVPETDAFCDDDLCLRIGMKVKTFERLASEGIITVADLKQAVADAGWYVKIPKVGKKTAQTIEERLEIMIQ